MRILALLVLPLLVAWDNPLEGTIYDRDLEGIPRVAWIDIGRIMNCVRENQTLAGASLVKDDSLILALSDLEGLLHYTVDVLRSGDIGGGTELIDVATHRIGELTRVDCSYVRGLRETTLTATDR